MTSATAEQETRSMAKTTKAMMVDQQTARLLESYLSHTGLSLTRVMNAALLKFFFDEPGKPESRWLQAAHQLDDGKIDLAGVPEYVTGMRLQYALDLVKSLPADKQKIDKMPRDARDKLDALCKELLATLDRWKKVQTLSDDPVESLAKLWQRLDDGTNADQLFDSIKLDDAAKSKK